MSPISGTSECMLHGPLTALIIGTSTSSTLKMRWRAYQAFSSSLTSPRVPGISMVLGLLGRLAVGQPTPVGVVVLAGTGVDQHLDLAVACDVGERVRHLVVRLPAPHQAVAVGVALHEQDAVVGQLELVVGVAVLVLAESRSFRHVAPFGRRHVPVNRATIGAKLSACVLLDRDVVDAEASRGAPAASRRWRPSDPTSTLGWSRRTSSAMPVLAAMRFVSGARRIVGDRRRNTASSRCRGHRCGRPRRPGRTRSGARPLPAGSARRRCAA